MTRRLAVAVLAVVVLAVVGACGSDEGGSPPGSPGPHPVSLPGSQWTVVSIAGQRPVRGSEPTIAFDGNQMSGSGGCNHFSGRFQYEPTTGEIAFGELGMTAMACLEAQRNATETRFFQLLGTVTEIATDPNGFLVLHAPGGDLVCARAGQTIVD